MAGNMAGYDQMSVMNRIKRTEIQTDLHCVFNQAVFLYTSSTSTLLASFNRKLKLYPATDTEMGSPNGATCSMVISSPGIKPISISFKKSSSFSTCLMITAMPVPISESLFIGIIYDFDRLPPQANIAK